MLELIDTYGLQLRILGHVTVAMLLEAGIGLDREIADKPAGLRTHILVAGAAALLVSLGDVIVQRFDVKTSQELVRTDPLRIIEAVIIRHQFPWRRDHHPPQGVASH